MILLFLATIFYCLICLLLVLLVLIQRGKGSMGLGNMGGTNQMLFGSSGGQDIFQKTTWALCAILLGGSMFLSVVKSKYNQYGSGRTLSYSRAVPTAVQAENVAPVQPADSQD